MATGEVRQFVRHGVSQMAVPYGFCGVFELGTAFAVL